MKNNPSLEKHKIEHRPKDTKSTPTTPQSAELSNHNPKTRSKRWVLTGLASIAGIAGVIVLIFLGLEIYKDYQNKHRVTTYPTEAPTDGRVNSTAGETTPSSTSDGKTPAKPGEVCTQKTIPYNTVTKYDSNIPNGQQLSSGGYNGTEYSCSTNGGPKRVTGTVPPIPKTITIGTKVAAGQSPSPPPTSPPPPQYTYSQALQISQNNCRVQLASSGGESSSAFPGCVAAYMHSFGY